MGCSGSRPAEPPKTDEPTSPKSPVRRLSSDGLHVNPILQYQEEEEERKKQRKETLKRKKAAKAEALARSAEAVLELEREESSELTELERAQSKHRASTGLEEGWAGSSVKGELNTSPFIRTVVAAAAAAPNGNGTSSDASSSLTPVVKLHITAAGQTATLRLVVDPIDGEIATDTPGSMASAERI